MFSPSLSYFVASRLTGLWKVPWQFFGAATPARRRPWSVRVSPWLILTSSRRSWGFWIGLVSAFTVTAVAADDDSRHLSNGMGESIVSVLIHRDRVFASTPGGIYRATFHDRKWVRVPMPNHVPRGGCLAKQEPATSFVYYSAQRTIAASKPSANGNSFGLYRFEPISEKWELVSSKHYFCQVYVRDDWSIYGVGEAASGEPGFPLPYDRVVLMSTDSGQHWKTLPSSEFRAIAFVPSAVFPDPDHDGLICVTGAIGRKAQSVAQAENGSYRWQIQDYWDWQESHYPTSSFFRRLYHTQSTLFLYCATLDNYFSYPFGNETQVAAFEVGVARSYDVKQGGSVVVPVEVTFRERSELSATLVDTERGHDCWELNRVLPNGNRETIRVGASSNRSGSTKRELCDGTELFEPGKTIVRPSADNLCRYRLTNGKSYKRSLDLAEFGDFSKPGTYRVQLVYDNGQVASREKDEWVGSFTSRVFEIKISAGL
jgi:hypothetical protein